MLGEIQNMLGRQHDLEITPILIKVKTENKMPD